jgi:hypothetical protein
LLSVIHVWTLTFAGQLGKVEALLHAAEEGLPPDEADPAHDLARTGSTKCADLHYRVVEGGARPMVFAPLVNFGKLEERGQPI